MYSSKDQTYRFNQPFLKEEVQDYREVMTEQPFPALFYEFSIERRVSAAWPGYRELTYIPNGGVDILFVVKGERKLMEFVGLCTQMKQLLAFQGARYFGVRLYPGTRVVYHGVCLNELINEEHFFRGCESPLQDFFLEMEGSDTLEDKIKLFCRHFGHEMNREEMSGLLRCLLEEISNSHGTIRISELAERTHYSERHISRIFREAMGVSPKTFSRIIRFQYVVSAILCRPRETLCDYLGELGYSDQAHFQREFKEYTGITPGRFVQRVRS